MCVALGRTVVLKLMPLSTALKEHDVFAISTNGEVSIGIGDIGRSKYKLWNVQFPRDLKIFMSGIE